MSPSSGSRDEPITRDDFAIELERLVTETRGASVSIEGAYNVRSPRPDKMDYTIEISAIAKRVPEWARGGTRE